MSECDLREDAKSLRLRDVDRLVAARGEMTRTFTRLSLKLRQVLTYQQWQKLERRRSEWRSRRMQQGMRRNRRPGEMMAPRRPRRPANPPEPSQPPKP